ncbi:N-formylglutamate amidohydrolase [Nitratireductor kimnyeongensis]|uniref:N-formylglutamate amidohydrolase n=1 Tax=Nitratireductor kimnyeongensis TaxID=430679 RepID=A0ABW0TBF8_9HYPH|nr:N-formylglutamate amidohydrolase [Nitratireductor kimnyeongensis]QZZ36876.1 N-formylglutamate amidohydrolase [Nitratireductor kimnyeongensis]
MNALRFTSPFELIPGDPATGVVLIADHAKRALPEAYGALGLPASEFERHIAYDIGVEMVTRTLSAKLGVPAVLGGFSRLLIDPNRGINDPTLIRQIYDGTIIPGNYPLSPEERQNRIDQFYRPFHDAVAAAVDGVEKAIGGAPLIIAIHSFTPSLLGRKRPWEVGILWDIDNRAASPLIETLRADGELTVGDNEPYDGAYPGDTMHQHATTRGFPYALVEIRQDLIAGQDGAIGWAERLSLMVEAINARPDIHQVKHFGSRTEHM